ncbi:CBS domain-containing protein [Amnibacterium sp. CER49]|uniref:magnesium transporter MgtE N-terminal domain-containing protein n=1 Tax=Amnibacterium sp. CER49 TaxID=3039161 RepID=UPI002448AB7C|nr:CBS domain-containing protein [Amnibacterium sp. CER49]MDH2445325.1 CBS domain-containing protein [Amnibacterium sp. CER49]
MSTRIFVARLAGCAVFDRQGDRLGRVRDVVVVYRRSDPPRVVGMVVEIPGRRRVFLSIGRIVSIGSGQVITTGLISVRRFEQRASETRVLAEMLGRRVLLEGAGGEATIEDVAIEEVGPGEWEVAQVFVRRPKTSPSPFAKGATMFVRWSEVRERHGGAEGQSAAQLIQSYADLQAADLASTLLDLPEQRRLEVVKELPDERLADVLEEMPEAEGARVLAALGDDRAADVLEAMQPDDAADLIASLPDERSETLLDLMEPDEAEDVRTLLRYDPDTAGGLMTTEPIVLSSDATVAEGLALIRRHELAPALGAAICITLPPYEPPTGRFLGIVHFQRMLRYPPHERMGTLLDTTTEPVRADTSAAEVSRILASYNLVQVPVVDANHRLVGVVTVDDVLDRLLPDDWRSSDADDEPRTPPRRPTTDTGVILTRPRRAARGRAR